MNMNILNKVASMQDYRQDPQNLSELPLLSPPAYLWAKIEDEVLSQKKNKRWFQHATQAFEFALAASLIMMVVLHIPQQLQQSNQVDEQLAKIQNYSALLDQSWQYQEADKQVLTANKALKTSNLQDQLAVVDSELNTQPRSRSLWLQRTNLMEQLLGFYEPPQAQLMVLK